MGLKPNNSGLSLDQAQVLRAHATRLFEAVSAYGVSPLRVQPGVFSEADVQSNRVWSIVEFYSTGELMIDGIADGGYRTDEMLVPRFVENALAYHLADITYSDVAPLAVNPHTSLFFICTACASQGCQECAGEGQFTFLATWDENVASYLRN